MFINGQWITSEKKLSTYDKATLEKIADIPDASLDDVKYAIDCADIAFKSWSKTTPYERADYLYQAYQLMLERKEHLAQIMSKEQGKPLRASLNEVQYAADFLLWFAEEAKRNYGESIPSAKANQRFWVNHYPVGVVGAITPWNYPISMLTRKIAPALAAGCTVVLKPADITSLCAQETFKIFADINLPAGVVNLITTTNAEQVGTEFCTNPKIQKITFTGSTAVGKHLAQLAGANLKKISMELGGHAPALVLKDADPVYAAKGLALITYLNTGQACISPNRIFIHHDHAEAFLDEFVKRVKKLTIGYGLDPATQIGPLINTAAIEKISKQVTDAVSKGAKLLLGGELFKINEQLKGSFYLPTVLSNVTEDMLIYREESFGPIAPIIIYSDEDDLIAMANDTEYGLAAYIYTNNLSQALLVSESLNFGMIGINDINPTSAAAPFGGIKQSGMGREGARQGLLEYLNIKTIGISI